MPRSTAMSRPSKKNRLSGMASIYLLMERGPSPNPGGLPPSVLGVCAQATGLAPDHTRRRSTHAGLAPRRRRRRRRRRLTALRPEPGKKIAISRAADSAESEPWTRFSVSSVPRSPRIVPGGGLGGVGRPHQGAHDLPGVLGALDHQHQRRRPGDEGDQVVVEGLALVLGVVAARRSRRRSCAARRRPGAGPCARGGR